MDAGFIVMVVIMLLVIIFCFRVAIVTGRARKMVKQQKKSDKKEDILRYSPIVHIGGLNVPENCTCSVTLDRQGLTIICSGNEILLNLDKIRNVDFQMDIDEKQVLKSSLAGGIVGTAAFGMSGAIIGSRPKSKTKREIKCYAIISYESNQGEYKTFILRDELPNSQRCSKLVDALRPKITVRTNRVEL